MWLKGRRERMKNRYLNFLIEFILVARKIEIYAHSSPYRPSTPTLSSPHNSSLHFSLTFAAQINEFSSKIHFLFLTYEKNTFYVAGEKFHNDSIADIHPLLCEGCVKSFDIEMFSKDTARVEFSCAVNFMFGGGVM